MSDIDQSMQDTTGAGVAIPMNAVDPAASTSTRLVGEHGIADSLNKFTPSSAGRSESFPCTKKSNIEDQVIVSYAPEDLPPDPAPA